MAMAAAAAEVFGAAAPPTPPITATRQDAIAKAVELRALHAALLQRGVPNGGGGGASASRSPAITRLPPIASPALSRTAAAAAATVDEDYPVFTPAYNEMQMAGLSHICQDNRSRSENWSGIALDRGSGGGNDDDAAFSDYDNLIAFSSSNSELRFPSSTDHHRRHKVHPAFLRSAPSADRFLASAGRAIVTAGLKAPATCGRAFRPATIGRDHGIDVGALKYLSSSGAPPLSSTHHASEAAAQTRPKHRGAPILSWIFPRTKKKAKLEMMSPNAIERENMSQLLKEWGLLSLDSLRRELADANAHRDAALQETAEMRSSLGELTTKLVGLESYCSELKKALRQATSSSSNTQSRRSTRSIGASRELPGPVSREAMVEGFLQIASEARLSVKQFCKALIQQVEEPDNGLADKLNLLLQPFQLMITDKHCSKLVLYHLEAFMNQVMYQDFENCTFQKNGSPRCLDPKQDSQESFASFVALRNLSWNEVLRKGTKYYSEDFSQFCDQKMSCIVSTLKNWSRPWPEQLLQCFFVAAKCVWLLHLLAFSFTPALTIMRVEERRTFDQMYMDDILPDKQQLHKPCQVKIMVMPGFYVQDRVLKCRVLTT